MSVVAVSLSPSHTFSKTDQSSITLVVGHGVLGDCHAGPNVQHRSRLKIQPAPPNLRQVHLMQSEIFQQVQGKEPLAGDSADGSANEVDSSEPVLLPGQLGENITTVGIDLLGLSEGTLLRFLDDNDDDDHEEAKEQTAAAVRITGLRNPCPQIEKFRKGLQERFIVRDQKRKIVARKAGIMGVVEKAGIVRPGMRIVVVDEGVKGFKPLGCVWASRHSWGCGQKNIREGFCSS